MSRHTGSPGKRNGPGRRSRAGSVKQDEALAGGSVDSIIAHAGREQARCDRGRRDGGDLR